jgi:hypothetical protein
MHARSRIALSATVAALALCVSARTALSQQVIPSPSATSPTVASQALAPRTPPADVAASTRGAGPTVDAARAGVTQESSEELKVSSAAQRRRGLGQPVALMVVGGAALLAGLIIGDDAGTVIAVGGALIGLYGLYEYLQ